MKKFKKIASCLMAICTIGNIMPLNTLAVSENTTMNDNLREFLINAKDNVKPCDVYSKNCMVITIKYLGLDNNGDKVYVNNEYSTILGFDEQGNAIISDHGTAAIISKCVGFDDGKCIVGSDNDELIWFNEDGNPEIVSMKYMESELYKTIDVNTGEDILVKTDGNYGGTVIQRGDVTADTETDIRDVTAFNQDIVKANELPDYLDEIADIDDDGEVSVKDLALLKQYLIGTIDSL